MCKASVGGKLCILCKFLKHSFVMFGATLSLVYKFNFENWCKVNLYVKATSIIVYNFRLIYLIQFTIFKCGHLSWSVFLIFRFTFATDYALETISQWLANLMANSIHETSHTAGNPEGREWKETKHQMGTSWM